MRNILSKLLFLIPALFAGITLSTTAAPAYPGKITVTQADGTTLDIYIHGDEFVHYKTTSDGYNIAQAEDGNYYYVQSSGLDMTPGNIKAHNPNSRTSAEKAQLYKIGKGIPNELMQSRAKQKREQLYREKAQMRENGYVAPMSTTRATGTISTKTLVILVSFSDVAFTINSPNQSFHNMLNQTGYNANGTTGSVKDYFYENTNGKFNPTFDVYGPYTLKKTRAYYGANDGDVRDVNLQQMILDVCNEANADIDFSQYSSNGSTYVDDIFIYYAGVNEAEGGGDDTIWPQAWGVNSSPLFDGKLIGNFACASELSGSNPATATMASIGMFCHEFGHTIGLPDLYDVTLSGYNFEPYFTSLMSNGNYNNDGRTPPALSTIERNIISNYLADEDWVEITELNNDGNYSLMPLYGNKSYRLNTSNKGEYFILEARSKNNKWDEYITGYTRGEGDGLLVFHVDQSNNMLAEGYTAAEAWHNRSVNSNFKHECYKVVCANAKNDISDWFFPGTSNITTLDENNAFFRQWYRDYNNFSLNNITKSGENINFSLTTKKNILLNGRVTDINKTPVFGASVFLFPKNSSPSDVTIQDGHTPTPVGNNTLTRSSAGEKYTTTDAQGYFSFPDIAVGDYEVYASKENYIDYHANFAVSPVSSDLDVQLNTLNLSGNSIRKSWFTEYTHSYPLDNIQGMMGSAYSLSDLTSESNPMQLVGADFYIGETGDYNVIVYKNKTAVGNKTIHVTTTGMQYVELLPLNAILNATDEIIVALEINMVNFSTPVTIKDKGNRNGAYVSDSGDTWDCLTYNGRPVIWKIGAYFCAYSPASGISLQTTAVSIKAGDYEKIKYSLTPAGSSGELTWSSDNESVAIVDATGVVMALKKGTANITASLGSIRSNVATITVTENEIETISSPTVDESASTASLSWTSNAAATKWTVRWKGTWDNEYKTLETANKSIVLTDILPSSTYQIEIGGERTYKPEEFWGYTTTSFSTTSKPMAERIDISDTIIELSAAETQSITADIYPANAWNSELIWSSSDEGVATVSQNGLVRAVKSGTAKIKVRTKYDDISAECTVVVGKGIEITAYQNSAYIEWADRNWTGKWNVVISNRTGEVCNAVTESNEFYYERLLPYVTYTITISNITTDAGQQTINKTTTFSTLPSMNPFAYIDGIKGTYNSTDKIQLVLGGITCPIQSVEWEIDGDTVHLNAPTTTLPAGEHTIVVKITTSEETEYITKKIIVN